MSDDFKSRLESAIERGKRRAAHSADQQRAKEMSAEELKRLHTSYRLSLSDRIEPLEDRNVAAVVLFLCHEMFFGGRIRRRGGNFEVGDDTPNGQIASTGPAWQPCPE